MSSPRPVLKIRRWMIPVSLIVCAGCQILSVADVETPAEPPAFETADLEKLLAAGQWEADRDWSVLKLTSVLPAQTNETSAKEPSRWRFVLPAKMAAELESLRPKYADLLDHSAIKGSDTRVVEELTVVSQKATEIGWHAAILLTQSTADRLDAAPLHEHLLSESDSPNSERSKIPPAIQAAGMEAWCRALSNLDGDPEVNFAPAGRLLEAENLAEDVRAELFRGIARKIAPRQIPGLNEVMVRHESDRKATPLHLAAMEACVIHAWHLRGEQSEVPFEAVRWPDGLASCRFSEDITLRKLYGRWAALAGHADAVTVLKAQRLDNDLGVRETAVLSLGVMAGESVHNELLAVLAKGTDPERVAAITCLGRQGTDEILRFVQDGSPKVRAAVATELGRVPSKTAALTLSDFLRDRNPDVQLAALEACRQPAWKDVGQVPLLLHALRVGLLRTRMSAMSQLRQVWGQEPAFPLDGTSEERDTAVRRLARDHDVSSEVFTAFSPTDDANAMATASPLTGQDDVRRLVQRFLHPPVDQNSELVAEDVWKALDATAIPVIEQELGRAAGPRAEQVYRDILPRWHGGYAALLSLEQADVVQRRQAARELRDLAERGSLSPCLLRRLSQRMTLEQDRQVWQDVLAAILPDALPDAAQIALVALNSPWPDLRLLGCAYFDRHPQPEYAAWLLPRLQDADYQVRLNAIRILARCGNPAAIEGYSRDEDALGLRSFLTDPDQQLRWEAVVAMCILGDAQAAQELIRQSYDPRPQQREQAVQTMGQTGQARFIEPLLRRSWTETDRRVQLALLKSLDQLVPMDDRLGLAAESSISDKIKEWARWWEQRQRSPGGAASSPTTPDGSSRGSIP